MRHKEKRLPSATAIIGAFIGDANRINAARTLAPAKWDGYSPHLVFWILVMNEDLRGTVHETSPLDFYTLKLINAVKIPEYRRCIGELMTTQNTPASWPAE